MFPVANRPYLPGVKGRAGSATGEFGDGKQHAGPASFGDAARERAPRGFLEIESQCDAALEFLEKVRLRTCLLLNPRALAADVESCTRTDRVIQAYPTDLSNSSPSLKAAM